MSTTMMSHTTTTVMPSVHRSGVVADTVAVRINVIPASATMVVTDTIAVRVNIANTLSLLRAITGENSRRYQRRHQ